jgi:purine-binding chemotaxis protein CheW
MNTASHFLVFWLDQQRFALPVAAVDRVLQAVEVTPIHAAPGPVLGVINVQGTVLAVINLRRRCGLPPKEMDLDDQLVLVRTARRTLVLPVDMTAVMQCAPAAHVPAGNILPGLNSIAGLVKDEQGMILIHDPDALLSLEDERALEAVASSGEGAR